MPDRLRPHDHRLIDGRLVLRPMTEDDWDSLMRWNSDPEVLYFSEGDEVESRSLDEVQAIFRSVSQCGFTFLAELDGRPIGDCWLQEMNLPRILDRFPADADLRRIDLTIGATSLWGRGWGTRMIALLVRLGLDTEGTDALFGCDIADYNVGSRRAFERNGFTVFEAVAQPPGRKAKTAYHLIRTR